MSHEAVIIGSGAAGSAVAWELARQGWTVTILERGRNLRPGLGEVPSSELKTLYGSDELKGFRSFGFPDPILEPYTTRTQADARNGVARTATGAYGQLGAAVGGTSLHYNAKVPRLWKQDFTMLSDHGPMPGAQVADWPIGYDDLEPYYDEVEQRLGVQGDRSAMPARNLQQAPRRNDFAMPPGPRGKAASLLAEGARTLGWEPYPFPAAVNSRVFDGRPACNSCGLCPAYGCPVNARGDALVSFLNPALRTGRVRVIPRAYVHRVEASSDGGKAVAVHYRDLDGTEHQLPASTVVVAGNPINTARLLLLSADGSHPDGLGNSSGQLGRNMMFHNFTQGASVYPYDVRPLRSQSSTYAADELVGPFTGPEVTALGVPYIVGGILQVGGGGAPITYAKALSPYLGYGLPLKDVLKVGTQTALAGTQLIQQDMPQAGNRVDLDPDVTDFHGVPAARITYSPHQQEIAGSVYLGARLEAMHLLAPGATGAVILPYPILNQGATGTMHLAGTARMGDDPATSVCAPSGRLHDLDNVYVADASLFPTFPGFNPTLTIMANAMRIARGLATNPGE